MTAIPTLVFLALALAGTVLWVWALVDVVRRPVVPAPGKAAWFALIFFASAAGALVYLLVGRRATAGA